MLKQITGGNRDPKVEWQESLGCWLMTLYVEHENRSQGDGKAPRRETIYFFTSPDLKKWTQTSVSEGYFECPDFFELPVDGDPSKKKWVLTAASSDYQIGSFDGKRFIPESGKLKGHRGRGYYAAQTFSDLPDKRRVQIGWLQAPSPGMPFNQAMSLPLELSLRSTPEGPRLAWQPAREVEALQEKAHRFEARTLKEGDANPFAGVTGELLQIRVEFAPGATGEQTFTVRGVPIVYDAAKQELSINGHRTSAPLRDGIQRLVIYTDRTIFELFASDGLVYVPMPVIPKAEARSVELNVKGAPVNFTKLEAFELRSFWGSGGTGG